MFPVGKEILVFDGAMGSQLEAHGLQGIPEDLNLTHPEKIQAIHQGYAAADIITTNTFGLNRIKYTGNNDLKTLVDAAIANAKTAGKAVFFDIGPTGKLMAPMGSLGFDEAYAVFKEIVLLAKDQVDGFIVETFSDLYELKACILAIKENSDLPVFATMTFDANGRTLSGSSVEIMANTLEGLGVDALGINCSLGPKELYPLVKRLLECSSTPIIVQPNRGLPLLENGKSVYTLGVDEFDFYIEKMVKDGVSIIGGCCGTTPEFIERISRFSKQAVIPCRIKPRTIINSAQKLVEMKDLQICGERINPTGKKKIKNALIDQDYDVLVREALMQQQAGANLLDVNLGLPQIDEAAVMPEVVELIQANCDLPLQIDSSNIEAIEKGCRYYNGIPLINSVNGDPEVMDQIFPIAKKYGAVVLGLCMDHQGIPETAQKRFEIAKRIIKRASDFGLEKHRLMFDTLVVTASAQQDLVMETLKALRLIEKLGVKTALGVSNVSFGLPNRTLLNRTYLIMALEHGLCMPIMNPLDASMMESILAWKVLKGEDEKALEYIDTFRDYTPQGTSLLHKNKAEKSIESLEDAILFGLSDLAKEQALKRLEHQDVMVLINETMIPLLERIGKDYETGRIFLPQLISSAQAARDVFELLTARLPKSSAANQKIVLATVQGDVHDIGKNIVRVLLESHGYQVIDLGKDAAIEKVVEAVEKHQPFAVGLSALMTTTVASMEKTIEAIKASGYEGPVFVGGAVLNPEIAKRIKADYYTKDGLEMVEVLNQLQSGPAA